jgi:hypothetical protein
MAFRCVDCDRVWKTEEEADSCCPHAEDIGDSSTTTRTACVSSDRSNLGSIEFGIVGRGRMLHRSANSSRRDSSPFLAGFHWPFPHLAMGCRPSGRSFL